MSVDPLVYLGGAFPAVRRLSAFAGLALEDVDPLVWLNGTVSRLSLLSGETIETTDPIVEKSGRVRRLSRFAGETWPGPAPSPTPTPTPTPSPTTWDAARTGAALALSNGDLTVTGSSGWASSLGSNSRTTTHSFTLTMGTATGSSNTGVGFAKASANKDSYLGSDANSAMCLGTGDLFGASGSGPAFVGGDVVEAEWNSAGTMRFRVNGGAWSTPANVSGLGATVFPAVSINGSFHVDASFTGWDA